MGRIQFDYKDKVVMVTGAAAGIGRETALMFSKNGAKLALCDLDEKAGEQLVKEITNSGGEAFFYPCDVSQSKNIKAFVDETLKKYGQLNCACNNAGIEGASASIVDCTEENWDQVININLKGVWLSMKYQVPEILKSGGGAIVNLSSIAGLIGFPGLAAYTASKHGIAGLTKTASLEFAQKNIRVNAVCPGPIMTPMLERLMSVTPGFKDQVLLGIPERRIGKPEDVANAVLYLCSEQASYITGQCLAVDGGWVAQ